MRIVLILTSTYMGLLGLTYENISFFEKKHIKCAPMIKM